MGLDVVHCCGLKRKRGNSKFISVSMRMCVILNVPLRYNWEWKEKEENEKCFLGLFSFFYFEMRVMTAEEK